MQLSCLERFLAKEEVESQSLFIRTIFVQSKRRYKYEKLKKTTKNSKESFPACCKIILIDEKKKEKKVKEKKPNIFKNIIGKIKDAIFERKLMSDFKVKSSKRKTRTKTKVKKDF